MFSILNIYLTVAKWKLSAKLFTDSCFLTLVLVSVSVRVSVRNLESETNFTEIYHVLTWPTVSPINS